MKIRKSSVAIIVLSLFYTFNSCAQIGVGIKSGFNYSKYNLQFANSDIESSVSSGRNTGFNTGIIVDIPFGEGKLGLQPELLFTQKGANVESVTDIKLSGVPYKSVKTKQSLNYIEIPVMFKYKFGNEDNGFYLAAGPYFSFGLNGSLTESYTGSITNTSKVDVTFGDKVIDQYTKTDVGFNLGFGGYFSVGESSKLILDARIVSGGTNILNDKNKTKRIIETVSFEAKNRSLQLSIGYLFTLQSH